MRFPVLSSKAVSRQTAKQSAFLRIQVRASSQTKGLERGWTYGRVRLARFARLKLLRHASPISLLILRKKPTVLQSSFTLDLWQTTSASTSKRYVYNTSMGNSKSTFRTTVHCFFPDFLSTQNRVRVIEGEFIWKDLRGKKKLLRVSGRFELPGVELQ